MTGIKTVGVAGAGTMGRGIAQLCAQKGFAVRLYDAFPRILSAARGKIQENLAAAVEKGRLAPQEARDSLARIAEAPGLSDLGACELVVEAVSEDLKVKRELFRALGSEAILASNTSSLPVRELAAAAKRPERVVGMHFFNPPVAMKLIEVIRAPQTSEASFKGAWDFALALGKTPVAAQDTPGFIVNRVMRPYYLDAMRLAGEGRGDYAMIDKSARELGGVPMGPFELMDLIGLDVNLAITRVIHEALGRPKRLEPHFIQERLVEAGSNGRKNGQGFYSYDGGRSAGDNPEALNLIPKGQTPARPSYIWERLMGAVAEEARQAASEGVASESDIDTAVRLAMNFPKGPFEWRRRNVEKA